MRRISRISSSCTRLTTRCIIAGSNSSRPSTISAKDGTASWLPMLVWSMRSKTRSASSVRIGAAADAPRAPGPAAPSSPARCARRCGWCSAAAPARARWAAWRRAPSARRGCFCSSDAIDQRRRRPVVGGDGGQLRQRDFGGHCLGFPRKSVAYEQSRAVAVNHSGAMRINSAHHFDRNAGSRRLAPAHRAPGWRRTLRDNAAR